MTNLRTISIRSWALAIAALLVAAVAVIAYAQSNDASDENPVVIRLGNEVLRLDSLEARFEIAIRTVAANRGVPLDDQVRAQLRGFLPQYLEQVATELVLVDEAESRGISAPEDEVEATIERIRANTPEDQTFEDLLGQAGFESEAQLRNLVEESLMIDGLLEDIRESIEVTDEQLRLAYQTRREEFRSPVQACARHILLETAEAAEDVLAELEGGADFAELAQERSTGPSGPQGGDLGCLAPGQTVAPFDEALFAAPVGEPVGPVETQFGFHVILVSERSEAELAPFDEVRETLREQIVAERADSAVQALIENSGVQTYPDRLPVPEEPEQPEAAPEGAMPEAPAEDAGAEDADTEDGSAD